MNNLAYSIKQVERDLRVPFIDLRRQYFYLKDDILKTIDETLSSGQYILGDHVAAFENKVAAYLGCRYVLGVANGTDALILALKSLDIGMHDEVILPVNSFVATAGAVAAVGAKPVCCDVTDDLNIDVQKIESLITPRTKAIIPVHLTGRPAEMDSIMAVAKKYSLAVIEDAAQSIGASYKNRMTGAIGDIACFSLHPLKNLHVYGDGGLISTNDENVYQKMKLMRNHGLLNRDVCAMWGLNSRLDAIHASIANIGFSYLTEWNLKRRKTATIYHEKLKHVVKIPKDLPHEYAVYHNYVIFVKERDALMTYLLDLGIETKIHYPIPIHLQPAAASLAYQQGDFPVAERHTREMMSLPIYSELQDDEIQAVIDGILSFFQGPP